MTTSTPSRPRPATAPARLLPAAVAVGLAVGALTSPGQTLLGGTALAGLVNAVGPWLLAPFLLGAGAGARSPRLAAVAGVLACTAQVPGYYLVSVARGFAAAPVTVAEWLVAGVVGGAVLGVAGWSWRHGAGRWRGAGAALLVAVWLTEALVLFGAVLRYWDSAAVSAVVGLGLLAGLGAHDRQWGAVLRWLAPALVSGTAGFLVLLAVL